MHRFGSLLWLRLELRQLPLDCCRVGCQAHRAVYIGAQAEEHRQGTAVAQRDLDTLAVRFHLARVTPHRLDIIRECLLS